MGLYAPPPHPHRQLRLRISFFPFNMILASLAEGDQ